MDIKEIKAVIFDMDGVISDTQVIHAKVESELLKNYGIKMSPEEITTRFAGVGDKEMFEQIFADFNKKIPGISDLVKVKWEKMNSLVRGSVVEIAGTKEFIGRLRERNILLAVGSASKLQFIKLVLSELNLMDKFDAIASAEEVEKGKPEPDLFLLAAKRLRAKPEECLVVEDGVNGMIAAKRAGMWCIGLVRNGVTGVDYPADLLVKDLREVSINF